MPSPYGRLRPLAPAVLLLAAGACAGDDPIPLACPQPAIIDGLASVERYRGDPAPASASPGPAGQRPEDLVYSAALQNISGGCRIERGDDLDVNIGIEVVVNAGPAFAGETVDLPYFVAVTGPGGQVVERRDFVARVVVPEGARRGGSAESLGQRFAGVGRQGGGGYRVLFGFALPREEALRLQEGAGG